MRTPMDNGWEPVGIYWELLPFKPPSKVHSTAASCPTHSTGGSLGVGVAVYSSSSQVFRDLLVYILLHAAPILSILFAGRGRKEF